MQEFIPLFGGAIVGLMAQQVSLPRWLRMTLFVALCFVVGALSSWINGELAVSGMFISFDTLLVWLGALLAVGLLQARRRYVTPRS